MREHDAIAVIPARAGSKGLPQKNLRPFCGEPLVAHSIWAALGCRGIRRCLVSTEDSEIRNVALKYGAEVIDRPVALAEDMVRTQEVVRHVLDVLRAEGDDPGHVVLLQPTSPLRTAQHVEACLEAFFASRAASAISVTEIAHHPYKGFLIEDGWLRPLFDSDSLERQRQLLPKAYRQNGAIYVVPTQTFLRRNTFFIPPALAFVMPPEVSIDIDSELDFMLGETLKRGVPHGTG